MKKNPVKIHKTANWVSAWGTVVGSIHSVKKNLISEKFIEPQIMYNKLAPKTIIVEEKALKAKYLKDASVRPLLGIIVIKINSSKLIASIKIYIKIKLWAETNKSRDPKVNSKKETYSGVRFFSPTLKALSIKLNGALKVNVTIANKAVMAILLLIINAFTNSNPPKHIKEFSQAGFINNKKITPIIASQYNTMKIFEKCTG